MLIHDICNSQPSFPQHSIPPNGVYECIERRRWILDTENVIVFTEGMDELLKDLDKYGVS